MKITEETRENSDDKHSELYFTEDEELKAVLEEEEKDLMEDLSFLPEKLRKILDEIFDSKTHHMED